jgi:tRNA(fMet)-specific endonuclease VapC
MTRRLVDTSAYSAFMRGHPTVRTLLQRCDSIALSPVTLGELYAGFASGGREKKNRNELEEFLSSARVSVVDVTAETSEYYGAIHRSLRQAGTPIPANDLWIAASAMEFGFRVVTTDEHFTKVRQIVVDYCSPHG